MVDYLTVLGAKFLRSMDQGRIKSLAQRLPMALGILFLAQLSAQAQSPSLPELEPSPPATSQISPDQFTDSPFVNPSSTERQIGPLNVPASYAASSYVLGPGDQVFIDVYGYEEYTGPAAILPDGTISLPLVGKVSAVGQTTDQLTQQLTAVLDTILVDPSVSIRLNALRPIVVNVSGEVYRPGPVQLQGAVNVATGQGAANAPASVSQALIEAGGVTQTADIREIVVMRALPNGETIRTPVNLWDALGSETARVPLTQGCWQNGF